MVAVVDVVIMRWIVYGIAMVVVVTTVVVV